MVNLVNRENIKVRFLRFLIGVILMFLIVVRRMESVLIYHYIGRVGPMPCCSSVGNTQIKFMSRKIRTASFIVDCL